MKYDLFCGGCNSFMSTREQYQVMEFIARHGKDGTITVEVLYDLKTELPGGA